MFLPAAGDLVPNPVFSALFLAFAALWATAGTERLRDGTFPVLPAESGPRLRVRRRDRRHRGDPDLSVPLLPVLDEPRHCRRRARGSSYPARGDGTGPAPGPSSALRLIAYGGVVLASAELFARLDDALTWGAPLVAPYRDELLLTRDSGLVRGRPGYRFPEMGDEQRRDFRGPEIALTAPPGRERIAALGASETFGLYESEGGEFPARLRVLLDSLEPGRFEVFNTALPGMGLPSMARYYTRVVAPFPPSRWCSSTLPRRFTWSPSLQRPRRPGPPTAPRPEAMGWSRAPSSPGCSARGRTCSSSWCRAPS